MDDSNEEVSGLHDRVRRLSLFTGVDLLRPTVPDSDGSGTETPTSVSDRLREDLPDPQGRHVRRHSSLPSPFDGHS